jgi:ADP-ribose pyrophosphatase YjhB (NUDIX family)
VSRLPDFLQRPAYQIGYVLLRTYSRLFRPHTRGVKCMLTYGDELLLIRHAYGPGHWDLPGGFCRRRETFAAAARREVSEELGISDARWTDLGELRRRFDGRHETLHGFRVELADRDIHVARAEVAEARWFPRGQLPEVAPIVHAIGALDAPHAPGLSPPVQG